MAIPSWAEPRKSSGFLLRLALVGLALAWFAPRCGPRVIDLDAPTWDPAVEKTLAHHSADFGGVDRWVYPGLEAGLLVLRLRAEGYDCPAVQDPVAGGTPKSGMHDQTCTRERSFPLPRTLIVQANADYGYGERITGISAYSVDASRDPLMQRWGRLLRRLGLIEPASLKVTGLAFDTSAELARYVVDSIQPNGWRSLCDRVTLQPGCAWQAELRQKNGFPPPTPVAAMDLHELARMLGSIGLRADGSTLEFSGADFTGAMRRVSVVMDPPARKPVRLVVRQGADQPFNIPVGGAN